MKYPFVLGCDLAAEVVAVGSEVAEVKVGDRRAGHGRWKDAETQSVRAFIAAALAKPTKNDWPPAS